MPKIPQEIHDLFIKTILDIDPSDSIRNQKLKSLIEDVKKSKIQYYFKNLQKYYQLFLDQEFKEKILDFLFNSCPPKNHFYPVSFRKFIGEVSQEIIQKKLASNKEILNILNDISLEYWVAKFDYYTIKLYHRNESITNLVNGIRDILERIVGFRKDMKIEPSGLGFDFHYLVELKADVNDLQISFNIIQDKAYQIPHNVVYICFWTYTSEVKLWDDIKHSTIDKVRKILEKFILNPNIQIVKIDTKAQSTTSLPKDLVESISLTSIKKVKLKHELIIDLDVQFQNTLYIEVVEEINGTYKHGFFTSLYVLVRKLLENLLIDCLRKYYTKQLSDKFFDTNKKKFHGFGLLRENFNSMIQEAGFISQVGTFEQKFIDLLKEFKDKGDIDAHSLFNLPHQDFIEERKDKLNLLIKRLIYIKENL